jgi:hypothetical protein
MVEKDVGDLRDEADEIRRVLGSIVVSAKRSRA